MSGVLCVFGLRFGVLGFRVVLGSIGSGFVCGIGFRFGFWCLRLVLSCLFGFVCCTVSTLDFQLGLGLRGGVFGCVCLVFPWVVFCFAEIVDFSQILGLSRCILGVFSFVF